MAAGDCAGWKAQVVWGGRVGLEFDLEPGNLAAEPLLVCPEAAASYEIPAACRTPQEHRGQLSAVEAYYLQRQQHRAGLDPESFLVTLAACARPPPAPYPWLPAPLFCELLGPGAVS